MNIIPHRDLSIHDFFFWTARQAVLLFTDEKDGALDHQKKKEFIAMKRKVLSLGGYDLELFISQSPEIQEVADYTILLAA